MAEIAPPPETVLIRPLRAPLVPDNNIARMRTNYLGLTSTR